MPEDYLTLRKILMFKDPSMLYGFNPYWAPFFCPECQEVYPYEEWNIHEDVYGTCPQGHRRRLGGQVTGREQMARMKHETMRDVDKALMQEVAHGTARAARIRELVSLGATSMQSVMGSPFYLRRFSA